MDLGSFTVFRMLSRRMAWLGQREAVLARNVANADTPNYRPFDLKPLDFRSLAERAGGPVRVATTDPRHLVGTRNPPEFAEERQRETFETTPTGNAVVLEEQLMKVGETAMNHRLMTNLYRKHLGMIRTVLGRGG